jgi:ubiquinone biosynthesis protein
MRRFVVQFLINVVAIAVVVLLFSLIHVTYTDPTTGQAFKGPVIDLGDHPWWFLFSFALLIAVLNAVIRPVILLLTGRWLIRSFGLLLVVTDVIIIWLASRIDAVDFTLASPSWFWGLTAALIIVGLAAFGQAVLGVDRPHIDVSDRQRAIWRVLDRLPTPRRSAIVENLRLMQVYETISAFGLEIGLERGPLAGVRAWAQGFLRSADPRLEGLSPPAKVRVMLQQLGPTYVKIGQMAASRSEALPPGWADELAKLQNTVPPFPYEEARAAIAKELGRTPDELYATFDQEPLAAASLAQVHRATLPDGREVVVKIQRPDVTTMVQADLGVLQDLAVAAEKRLEIAQRLDLPGVVREFAAGVRVELDYRNEAYHMRRMAGNMGSIPGVALPFVDDGRSARRVLTMGFVRGVKISDVAALDAAGIDREALAHTFLRAIIKQILIDGFFHADPHPGNIFVDTTDGTITFLDLGLIGQLTRDQRMDLLDLMASIQAKDSRAIATVAMRLCTHRGPVDEEAVFRAVDRIVYQYLIYGGGDEQDMGQVVSSILGSLYEQGLRMDQDFTLAVKAIIQAEEITRALSPSFSLISDGVADARSLIMEQVTAEKIVAQLRAAALQTGKEVVRRMPSLQEATLSWLDQYQKGKLVVELDTRDLSREIGKFSSVGRQLASAAIVAGSVVAVGIVLAAMLFGGQSASSSYLVPVVLTVVFMVLLLAGLAAAYRLIRPSSGDD